MIYPTDPGVFNKNFTSIPRLRDNWKWFLVLGLGFIFLGFLGIGASTVLTKASMVFLGSLLLIVGVAQIAFTITLSKWSGFFLSLLAGLLYLVTGFFMAFHPTISALSLTIFISGFYMMGGVFRIICAVLSKFEHWGWALFSGCIKFMLGLFIFLGWPETGLWIIGLFIGIELLFYGWFWVLISLTARSMKKYHKEG